MVQASVDNNFSLIAGGGAEERLNPRE